MIQFESLPFDVQLTILNFLEPLDILRLRKTCKTLHCTTSKRTVWIDALRRVCVRNTIFMPTFPIYDMSLSALEYAATGPERFLRTAINGNLLEPRSHLIIERDNVGFRGIFLVPGGRYLVTVDFTRVAVWDLGIPGCPSTAPQSTKPVSSLPALREFHLAILLVHPTEDGRGLTIFINYERGEILRFTVLRIYPTNKLPHLSRIAEVDVPHPPKTSLSFCSLSRNKVIYLIESSLNVWDYLGDAWTCIRVPGGYQKVIVSESAILLPYPDRVLVWKMSVLSKSTSQTLLSGFVLSDIPPAFTLKTPSNCQTVKECRGLCDWYSGSPQPLLFDFAFVDEFQRFEVVHTNEDLNDSVVSSFGIYPDSKYRVHESCRICNDTLISWWILEHCVEASITSPPAGHSSHTSHPINSITTLHRSRDDAMSWLYAYSSFCPFSGRFAYMDECAKIVDYFSESLPVLGLPPEPPPYSESVLGA